MMIVNSQLCQAINCSPVNGNGTKHPADVNSEEARLLVAGKKQAIEYD